MARLEAQSRAGYFPTPPTAVEAVAKLIRPAAAEHGHVFRLLDPCCGTGAALTQLAAFLGNTEHIQTFGVELQRQRYNEARQSLTHALCSDVFQAVISNGAFQMLWLNPPYDNDDEKLRQEHKFLLHCTRYLAPGGLLAFIVPQSRLSVSARYLASHYTDMRCYRFPDPEYESFKQVILLAVKKPEPTQDESTEDRVQAWSMEPLSPIPVNEQAQHTLEAGKAGDVLFSSRHVDPEVVAAEARRSGLWASRPLHDRLWPDEVPIARPLMPLRKGHLAMLIAAGFLNNLVLESSGKRVLVKGRTYKEFVLAESSEESETYREVLHTSVRVLDLHTGDFTDVQA